jgi:hypothetical protein
LLLALVLLLLLLHPDELEEELEEVPSFPYETPRHNPAVFPPLARIDSE